MWGTGQYCCTDNLCCDQQDDDDPAQNEITDEANINQDSLPEPEVITDYDLDRDKFLEEEYADNKHKISNDSSVEEQAEEAIHMFEEELNVIIHQIEDTIEGHLPHFNTSHDIPATGEDSDESVGDRTDVDGVTIVLNGTSDGSDIIDIAIVGNDTVGNDTESDPYASIDNATELHMHTDGNEDRPYGSNGTIISDNITETNEIDWDVDIINITKFDTDVNNTAQDDFSTNNSTMNEEHNGVTELDEEPRHGGVEIEEVTEEFEHLSVSEESPPIPESSEADEESIDSESTEVNHNTVDLATEEVTGAELEVNSPHTLRTTFSASGQSQPSLQATILSITLLYVFLR